MKKITSHMQINIMMKSSMQRKEDKNFTGELQDELNIAS